MSEDHVAAWRALLQAQAAAVRAIERDLDAARLLPLAWYDALLELNSAPGRRLRMTELSDRVVLSRTRVSRIVDELVRAGLVERTTDPDDRRSAFATITARGREELRRTAPHYLAGIERHFTTLLSARERKVVADALGRVAAHHRALPSVD